MRIFISALITVLLLCPSLWCQAEKVKFDGQIMLEYIKVLTSDSMEGRKSGLRGGDKAAHYIIDKLKEWGIEPAGENGTYKQHFFLKDFFNVEPSAKLEISPQKNRKQSFYHNQNRIKDEWNICKFSGSGNIKAEIVFAGFGIHAPEEGYDDYAGVDVKGKVVLITSGSPMKLAGKLGKAMSNEARAKAAQELGAKALLVCPPPPASFSSGHPYPAFFNLKKEAYNPDFVVISVNSEIVDYILFYRPEELKLLVDTIQKTSKPQSFPTGVKAQIRVKTTFDEERETFNVLGKISGQDNKLKEENIILGAHMDHLGISPLNDVFNGAYDNASGTAVVMEMARLMKQHDVKPKRTIIFALWAAEEQGLLGSKHYVSQPLYPLNKTVANLNLDCVGRGKDKIMFGCTYYSKEVWDAIEANIPKEALEGIRPRRGVGGSDQLAFLAKGVHGFHLVSGMAGRKIHHPRDDWDLINPDMLVKSARFIYHAALVLSNEEKNLLFPQRAERIFFKRENLANYRPLPSSYVLKNFGDTKNSDVDLQLIYFESKKDADPRTLKIQITEYLDGIKDLVKKAPGLALYGENRMAFTRSRAKRTRLLVGLKGSASFRDSLSWLNIFYKLGLQYILLDKKDLSFSGKTLNSSSRDLIQAASKAKILLLFSGLSNTQMKEVLKATQKPAVFISNDTPSQECLDLIKSGRHAFGLVFKTKETPDAYFARLKQAKEKVGLEHLIVWNESSLWKDDAQAKFINLFSSFIKEGWSEEDQMRKPLFSKVISGNFLNVLRMAKR